jgi:hypothetical protein
LSPGNSTRATKLDDSPASSRDMEPQKVDVMWTLWAKGRWVGGTKSGERDNSMKPELQKARAWVVMGVRCIVLAVSIVANSYRGGYGRDGGCCWWECNLFWMNWHKEDLCWFTFAGQFRDEGWWEFRLNELNVKSEIFRLEGCCVNKLPAPQKVNQRAKSCTVSEKLAIQNSILSKR